MSDKKFHVQRDYRFPLRNIFIVSPETDESGSEGTRRPEWHFILLFMVLGYYHLPPAIDSLYRITTEA